MHDMSVGQGRYSARSQIVCYACPPGKVCGGTLGMTLCHMYVHHRGWVLPTTWLQSDHDSDPATACR